MHQKLEDLKLILQNDRKVWFALAFVLVLGLIWLFVDSPAPKRPLANNIEANTGRTSLSLSSDAREDLIKAYNKDIEDSKRQSEENREALKRVESERKEFETRASGIFETLVDRMEQQNKTIQEIKEKISTPVEIPVTQPNAGTASDGGIDTLAPIGFDKATVEPPPPQLPQKPLKMKVLSPGDVVPVKLITGVNAPVDGTPYPVVFKIAGPITGPDGSTLDVGEARLIAAAQGSEADSRALFRFTDLALRHRDGRRSVVKVDGWIVGEDGIRGMSGQLIDKLGRLIAATAGISFVAAWGERVENQGRTTYIMPGGYAMETAGDSKTLDYAGASAITDSANRLGQILLDRYEKLVPVVEILPGREVVAVFSSMTEIELLEDDIGDEEMYGNVRQVAAKAGQNTQTQAIAQNNAAAAQQNNWQ